LTRLPNIQNGERIVPLISGAGKTEYPHADVVYGISHHMPKLTYETVKLQEENIEKSFITLAWTKSTGNKAKVGKWHFIKLKYPSIAKDPTE
jgi:hypothetical protein